MFKVKSSFARNILILLTGSSIAQAYTYCNHTCFNEAYTHQNDFGVLAIFVALTTILGSIVSGRYELAIIYLR